MPAATRTIPSLGNGISLQPPILRSPDQTGDEINTWFDKARGLGRRPPTEHVADLDIEGIEDAFIHHINRDINERYLVIIQDGNIRVFDATTGAEQTVSMPNGTGYLTGAPAGAFRAITVADHTFIVNTAQVVALDDVGADVGTAPNYANPGGFISYGQAVS